MFIFTHPVYPRRPWERVFKQLYNVGLILNFASFVITFTNWYARVPNTFDGYFTSTQFQLAHSLVDVLTGCEHRSIITINGITAPVSISFGSLPYLFLTLQHIFVGVFTLHGLLIVTDFAAKFLYTLNIRHFRYRGLSIPIASFLVYAVFFYSIALAALIATSQAALQFAQDYVAVCTKRFLVTNVEKFVAAESDVDVVFGTNLYFILATVVINMFFYACAVFHLIGYGAKESNARLLELEIPWEKGFFGKPNKLQLIEYCRQRKEAEIEVLKLAARAEGGLGESAPLSPGSEADADGTEAIDDDNELGPDGRGGDDNNGSSGVPKRGHGSGGSSEPSEGGHDNHRGHRHHRRRHRHVDPAPLAGLGTTTPQEELNVIDDERHAVPAAGADGDGFISPGGLEGRDNFFDDEAEAARGRHRPDDDRAGRRRHRRHGGSDGESGGVAVDVDREERRRRRKQRKAEEAAGGLPPPPPEEL